MKKNRDKEVQAFLDMRVRRQKAEKAEARLTKALEVALERLDEVRRLTSLKSPAARAAIMSKQVQCDIDEGIAALQFAKRYLKPFLDAIREAELLTAHAKIRKFKEN